MTDRILIVAFMIFCLLLIVYSNYQKQQSYPTSTPVDIIIKEVTAEPGVRCFVAYYPDGRGGADIACAEVKE